MVNCFVRVVVGGEEVLGNDFLPIHYNYISSCVNHVSSLNFIIVPRGAGGDENFTTFSGLRDFNFFFSKRTYPYLPISTP